jgi:putative transcriptional regulator
MIESGMLLVAPPTMPDHRFSKTVIMITQHGVSGTQGLCINRDLGRGVNSLIKPLGHQLSQDQPIYWGGPVAATTLWMLHGSDWYCENTLEISPDWCVSSSLHMFDEICSNGPEHARFCLGLTAWAPGQLEAEIRGQAPWSSNSSWLVAHALDPALMLSISPTDLWGWACGLSAREAVSQWLA